MGLGVYSDSGSLAGYYQGSNTANVTVGQTLKWHFGVENRMGTIQLAKIVFRLENFTTTSPTETTPSDTPQIADSSVIIPNGENSSIPFEWKILSGSNVGSQTYLDLQINGQALHPSIGAHSGIGFRFVFELWTLDQQSGTFQYTSQDPVVRVGSFLTVWFNVPNV